MPRQLWSFDQLERFTGSPDPEVRYWAADRLIRHHPSDCCDAVAGLLFDEHDLTPSAVAQHLGRHGEPKHHPMLVKAFRTLRGQTPGLCLQALTRLGYAGAVELAGTALRREELTAPSLAIIVEALGEFGFRTLMDVLQIDDTSWCFRTGPGGHIELRKTIKAVESGYDCDISAAIGRTTINRIAQRFRAGDMHETVREVAEWTCGAVAGFPHEPGADLPSRIKAAVSAFTRPALIEEVERLGQQFHQWVLGFQLSAAFVVARGVNFELSLRRARGKLDALLALAEHETAFLIGDLPSAIAVVCREDEGWRHKAQDWCLRMLEAKGPFFPKVIALETLGELGSVHFVSEMMDYLTDENSYVYGSAERALSRLAAGREHHPPRHRARGIGHARPGRRAQPARAAVRHGDRGGLRGRGAAPRLVHGRRRSRHHRGMGQPVRGRGADRPAA
jgi:hypothetical protein